MSILKDKNIDVVAIGRKGRDFMRRRFPVAKPESEERAGRVQIVGEHVNLLAKVEFDAVEEIAEKHHQAVLQAKRSTAFT